MKLVAASPELRIAAAALVATLVALLATPVAIRLARRTGFLDVPEGYKGHARPTPYLGGLAAVLALLVAAVVFGDDAAEVGPILALATVLCAVGTLDDRRGLSPWPRVVIEGAAGACLWAFGLGWTVLGSDAANLVLSVCWVVIVVNAFNLMDNMDGAAATVGTVCAAAIGSVAIANGNDAIAVLAFASGGAALGFLRYNLTNPARIFLGDGGSMPLGFILAACAMATVDQGAAGWTSMTAAVLLLGLPLFDTCMVVVSRRRRHVAVLSGGRDHITHRLRAAVGQTSVVAALLACAQAGLCAVAFAMLELETPPMLSAATALVMVTPIALLVSRLELPEQAS